ncbi:Hydroxyisourate hydrolase, partial [Auriscalpium vulgare]
MSKSPITCHILDSSLGKPAAGVEVRLLEYRHPARNQGEDSWEPLAVGATNSDGRCLDLLTWNGVSEAPASETPAKLRAGGLYKIVFRTKDYFESSERKSFYPWVEVTFEVVNPEEHYHIPLLISPYSYTTYRGS